MKVVQVVPSIQAEASGPSCSVPRLCDALARRGLAVALHVLAPAPCVKGSAFTTHAHAPRAIFPRLGLSPAMRKALRREAHHAGILHNHSLWMMPNIYPAAAVRGTRCRLVVSPRGTLSAYALRRRRWLKKLLWSLAQGRSLTKAACLHATAESEFEDIRRLGLHAPVSMIPNGIDLPLLRPSRPSGASHPRRLLFLSRIHPIKGVDVLLRAWRALQREFPEWELHLTGPGHDGYLPKMRKLAQALGLRRALFTGPAYGAAKDAAYREAELYVLPSHSENFGMTVAEALSHGLPAVVTKGAPWAGLERERCGWWIEHGEGPLTECLREALALAPEERAARGARGRVWMERDFSWARVGRMMHETYLWLLGGGVPPPWVRK